MSLTGASKTDISSLVAAAPLQHHLRLEVGFLLEAGQTAIGVDLLGGHASGGFVAS